MEIKTRFTVHTQSVALGPGREDGGCGGHLSGPRLHHLGPTDRFKQHKGWKCTGAAPNIQPALTSQMDQRTARPGHFQARVSRAALRAPSVRCGLQRQHRWPEVALSCAVRGPGAAQRQPLGLSCLSDEDVKSTGVLGFSSAGDVTHSDASPTPQASPGRHRSSCPRFRVETEAQGRQEVHRTTQLRVKELGLDHRLLTWPRTGLWCWGRAWLVPSPATCWPESRDGELGREGWCSLTCSQTLAVWL